MPSPSLPPLAWLRTVLSCSPCFAPQVGARRRALQRYSTAAAAHELPRVAENGSGQARGHPLVESKRLRGYRQVLKPVVQAKLQFQEASFPAPRDARPELPVLWSAELAQRTPCALDPPAAGSEDLSPVACPGSVMFLALPVTQPALRSRISLLAFPVRSRSKAPFRPANLLPPVYAQKPKPCESGHMGVLLDSNQK